MNVIEFILVLFAVIGIVLFLLDTFRDLSFRLFGEPCEHEWLAEHVGMTTIYSCSKCPKTFQVEHPNPGDPTIPEDRPRLKIIRGGRR